MPSGESKVAVLGEPLASLSELGSWQRAAEQRARGDVELGLVTVASHVHVGRSVVHEVDIEGQSEGFPDTRHRDIMRRNYY